MVPLPDGLATIVLDDTAAARSFAAMLPISTTLTDAWGQAKSGELPSPIDVTDVDRILDPNVGELYYWAPSNQVAVYHDDLGQTVPPPGLIRLGTIDSDAVEAAGDEFPVRIDVAGHTRTAETS